MRPYIAIERDMPAETERERLAVRAEIEMVRKGVARLPRWIKDASVLSGKPERAEVKLMLDKLDTAIGNQLGYDKARRAARETQMTLD